MSNKTKILAVGGVLAMAFAGGSQAAGTQACGGVAGNGTPVVGATANFIKDGFTPKCSANVTVNFLDSASSVGVKGGSAKGMHSFGGSSEGGGILQCESSSIATPNASAASVTATGC